MSVTQCGFIAKGPTLEAASGGVFILNGSDSAHRRGSESGGLRALLGVSESQNRESEILNLETKPQENSSEAAAFNHPSTLGAPLPEMLGVWG